MERKSCDPGQAPPLETWPKSTQCSRATRHHRIWLFSQHSWHLENELGPTGYIIQPLISATLVQPKGGWYNWILLYFVFFCNSKNGYKQVVLTSVSTCTRLFQILTNVDYSTWYLIESSFLFRAQSHSYLENQFVLPFNPYQHDSVQQPLVLRFPSEQFNGIDCYPGEPTSCRNGYGTWSARTARLRRRRRRWGLLRRRRRPTATAARCLRGVWWAARTSRWARRPRPTPRAATSRPTRPIRWPTAAPATSISAPRTRGWWRAWPRRSKTSGGSRNACLTSKSPTPPWPTRWSAAASSSSSTAWTNGPTSFDPVTLRFTFQLTFKAPDFSKPIGNLF